MAVTCLSVGSWQWHVWAWASSFTWEDFPTGFFLVNFNKIFQMIHSVENLQRFDSVGNILILRYRKFYLVLRDFDWNLNFRSWTGMDIFPFQNSPFILGMLGQFLVRFLHPKQNLGRDNFQKKSVSTKRYRHVQNTNMA